MQTNARPFFEEWDGIQANPTLETLRRGYIITLCTLIIYLVLFVIGFLISIGEGHLESSMLPIWTFLAVITAFNLAMNMAQGRYWKRIEQQRFGIVQGDRTFLAAEQPMLNVTSMQLPLTMKLRYRKETLLVIMGVVLLMTLFFVGVLGLNSPWFFTSQAELLFLFAAILFLVIIFAVILGVSRQWVRVTEDGITARYGGKRSTVRWEEARLLTMYDTFGAQKSGAAITYELSSAKDIVRWTWLRGKTYFVSQQPTVPLDEHNRQIQELLALVQAKTGLALYYLRH